MSDHYRQLVPVKTPRPSREGVDGIEYLRVGTDLSATEVAEVVWKAKLWREAEKDKGDKPTLLRFYEYLAGWRELCAEKEREEA